MIESGSMAGPEFLKHIHGANGYSQCRITESELTRSIQRGSLKFLRGCIIRKTILE